VSTIRTPQITTAGDIEAFIIDGLARGLDLDPSQIDPLAELPSFSLESMKAVELSGELATFLGRPVPPTILWDHETIRDLARHLAAAGRDATERAA
jgi:acyl carrier protein